MKKKLLCLFLVLAVAATPMLLAAAEAKSTEPVSLNILTLGDTWNPDNAFLPIIEEATNTKINMTVVQDDEYGNKRNVVMASGNYPNAIRIHYQDSLYASYTQDGLLLPLDETLERFPIVRNAYSDEIWDANRAADGKIYHIPRVNDQLYAVQFMFRRDVLEQKGLEVPQTPEELRAVFEALKAANPDPAYAPFVGNRNTLEDLIPFFAAFGTGMTMWQASDEDPNAIVFSPTTEKFKNALKFIRDLRKDGLFEQEWYVGQNRGIDKFYTGTAEFTADAPEHIEYRIPEVQKVAPGAVIDYIPVFKGQNGELYSAVSMFNQQGLGFAMVKGTTQEQMDAMFTLISFFYSQEGFTMLKYGVEGKTYQVVDGKIVPNPREANPVEYDMENMDRFDFGALPSMFGFTRDAVPDTVSDAQFELAKKSQDAANDHPIIAYGSNLNDEIITENMSILNSVTEELILKAILSPEEDFDAIYEEYQEQLVLNKLNEVTEAINRLNAPNR